MSASDEEKILAELKEAPKPENQITPERVAEIGKEVGRKNLPKSDKK